MRRYKEDRMEAGPMSTRRVEQPLRQRFCREDHDRRYRPTSFSNQSKVVTEQIEDRVSERALGERTGWRETVHGTC